MCHLQSAYLLLAAAANAHKAPRPIIAADQQQWMRLAARFLAQAGSDAAQKASQLAMNVGDYSFASNALSRMGKFVTKLYQ